MKTKTLLSAAVAMGVFQFGVLRSQTTYNYYYGNIHSQTSYSDGNKDASTTMMTTPRWPLSLSKTSPKPRREL